MDSYKGHNFEVAVSNVWLVLFAALFWMSFIYSFLIFILCNAAPKYPKGGDLLLYTNNNEHRTYYLHNCLYIYICIFSKLIFAFS